MTRWRLSWLVACCTACSGPPARAPIEEKVNCEDRLQQGKRLEQQGKDGDALSTYAPCLDSLVDAAGLLGKRYPPARASLAQRRSTVKREVDHSLDRGQSPPETTVHLLISLNSAVGDSAANLELFDRTRGSAAAATTLPAVRQRIWHELVEARRYSDALGGERFIREDVEAWLTVSAAQGASDLLIDQYALRGAAQYFEALAGVRRGADARALFAAVVAAHPVTGTYVAFITHSRRAGDTALAEQMLAHAKDHLNPSDALAVEKAIGSDVSN